MTWAQEGNGQVLEAPFGEALVVEAERPNLAGAREAPPTLATASQFFYEFCADGSSDAADDSRVAEMVSAKDEG